MTHKKMSWECSNKQSLFFSLILLISPTFLNSMEFYQGQSHEYANRYEQEDDNLAPALTEQDKETYDCCGHTWQEMMDAYEDAPAKAKIIVFELQNPYLFKNKRNARIFVGDPGTGKTATAKAIPHIARWYFKYISSGEIGSNGNRGEAAKRLREKIYEAVNTKKKVVIILDELNRLLENYESKNYDSFETATALWELFDELAHNQDVFFIGTMNRDYKIPEPFKNRMEGRRIVFPPIDQDKRRMLFRKKLEEQGMRLSKHCSDDFLDQQLLLLGNVSGRTYKNLGAEIEYNSVVAEPHNSNRYVEPDHIEQAFATIIKDRKEMNSGHEPLTEEEWREFHEIRSKIIEIKLQCAHKIGVSMGVTGPVISRSPGIDLDEAIGILESEFSESEKQLYMRVMKRAYFIERNFIDLVKHDVKEVVQQVVETSLKTNDFKGALDQAQENVSHMYTKYAAKYLKPSELNSTPEKSVEQSTLETNRTIKKWHVPYQNKNDSMCVIS